MAGEKKILSYFLLAFFVLLFSFGWFSEGSFDSGDSIQHFLISRYSFQHPNLFLDHWGKPFFTLVSSPFSQIGFIGIVLFNIFCGIGTAFFTWLIARKLYSENTLLVPLFVLFTPLYTVVLISGLTEPFFSFILMLGIYLMFVESYYWAALVVSMLPFVRSEGYLLAPLFAIVLIYRRKIMALPLLGMGTMIYSIIGYFYYHDFLWVIHENPYKGAEDIYGKGALFHFISKNEFIMGIPLVMLFLTGLISWTWKRDEQINNEKNRFEEIVLVYGSFITYFIAHSIFWWKGLYGSLGLIRVMAGVTPCAAIICLRGFNFSFIVIKKLREKRLYIMWITVVIVILIPFKQNRFPRPLDKEGKVLKQAGEWIKEHLPERGKTYYQYPYLALILNIDPYNPQQCGTLWGLDVSIYTNDAHRHDIVIWDSHFGPNEGNFPLERIKNNLSFQLLKTFSSASISDDTIFEVYLFERI